MGQQQMLLVILITIIVGIFTVVAINVLTEPQWVVEAREARIEHIESFDVPELIIRSNGEKTFIYPYGSKSGRIVEEYHFENDGDNLSDLLVKTTKDSSWSTRFETGRYKLEVLVEMEGTGMIPLLLNFSEE